MSTKPSVKPAQAAAAAPSSGGKQAQPATRTPSASTSTSTSTPATKPKPKPTPAPTTPTTTSTTSSTASTFSTFTNKLKKTHSHDDIRQVTSNGVSTSSSTESLPSHRTPEPTRRSLPADLSPARTPTSTSTSTSTSGGLDLFGRPHTVKSASTSSLHEKEGETYVPQNIYDNPTFFEGYRSQWEQPNPVIDCIERPCILRLLPTPPFWKGKSVVDMGCGIGGLCRLFRSKGAANVIGIDCSQLMLNVAEQKEREIMEKRRSKVDDAMTKMKKFLHMDDDEDDTPSTPAPKSKPKPMTSPQSARPASPSQSKLGNMMRSAFKKETPASPTTNGKPPAPTGKPNGDVNGKKQTGFAANVKKALNMENKDSSLPFVPINYIHSSIESVTLDPESADIITACMILPYIKDLSYFATLAFTTLKPNGILILSTDHPVTTCTINHPSTIKDEHGEIKYFPIDNWFDEGKRVTKWYVDGVIRYHRRLETLINTFITAGFTLERIAEPRASDAAEEKYPEQLKQWRRKPKYLCMRLRKPRPPTATSTSTPTATAAAAAGALVAASTAAALTHPGVTQLTSAATTTLNTANKAVEGTQQAVNAQLQSSANAFGSALQGIKRPGTAPSTSTTTSSSASKPKPPPPASANPNKATSASTSTPKSTAKATPTKGAESSSPKPGLLDRFKPKPKPKPKTFWEKLTGN